MNVAKTFALDLAAPVTNERPIVCVLYHPHNQILQSKWHILQNSTTVQTIFCDRLREILIHSNLHSRANSAPGTVPCSTDRCKALTPPLEVPIVTCLSRRLTCQSDNLVYAIACQSCNLIYVGATSRSLSSFFGTSVGTSTTTAANL